MLTHVIIEAILSHTILKLNTALVDRGTYYIELYWSIDMAKKGKKAGGRRLQDQQYRQIISSSRPEAEKALARLGLSFPSLEELPHALRMSAQMATVEQESTSGSQFLVSDSRQI